MVALPLPSRYSRRSHSREAPIDLNTVPSPKQTSRFGFDSVSDDTGGAKSSDDVFTELGLWLGGLVSFLDPANRLVDEHDKGGIDRTKEFRIVLAALKKSAKMAFEVEGSLRNSESGENVLNATEAADLSGSLREQVILGESHLASGRIDLSLWSTWTRSLRSRLSVEPVERLISAAESVVSEDMPEAVARLLGSGGLPKKWDTDLKLVIPRIATVMGYLRIVRLMLDLDAPLKTSILMFAKVDDLMRQLTMFINNRLQRFADDTDALFGSLDAAAYTASIELRKVHSNELKGLVDIRPTPLVYARIETAYSLLNDSLQMTLVNFVQLVDHAVEPTDVFPNLLTKEQQSIQLRENMWHLLQTVQKAEQDPDSCPSEAIRRELTDFRDKNLYFLFYKDMETVDRFIEEVLITGEKKDLVPILHRFGAYLETLLGQVNMRVVLANHPFEQLERQAHELMI